MASNESDCNVVAPGENASQHGDTKEMETFVDEKQVLQLKEQSDSTKQRITICSQSSQVIRHFSKEYSALRVQNIAMAFNCYHCINSKCILRVTKADHECNDSLLSEMPGMYLLEKNNNIHFPRLIEYNEYDAWQWAFDKLETNTIYYLKFCNLNSNSKTSIMRNKNMVNTSNINIDWDTIENIKILNLSDGIGGKSGEYKYIAPNGTIIESSAPVYTNNNYHFMEYLFNGQLKETTHTSYWLTNSNSNHQTLLFTFDKCYHIESVNICTTTHGNNLKTDRRSDYSINFKIEDNASSNATWMKDVYVPKQDTSKDILGEVRKHKIRLQNVKQMMINLYKMGNYGVCLKNIEIKIWDDSQ